MCGLVGIAGDLEFKDEATMKRLLILDYFRGPDSTGLASVRIKENEVLCHKMASHPLDLFDSGKFKEVINALKSKALIGHNRAATRGKVNSYNAHPFVCGHIVGAHNGTLDLDSWDRLCAAIGSKTEVDSEALFLCIEKNGIEETVKLMEEGKTSQTGAWALTWVNTKENTLEFLRNKHRPLWLAYSADFKKIFWASEYPMIQAALDLSNDSYELFKDKDGHSFFQCAENWHYKWDLDKLIDGYEKRPKAQCKKLEGREPKPVVSYTGGHGAPFQAGGRNGTTTTSLGFPRDDGSVGNVFIEVLGNCFEPFGGYIPRDEFQELIKYGCSWCGADIAYGEAGITVLEQQDAILCPECSGNDPDNNRIYADHYNYSAFHRRISNG